MDEEQRALSDLMVAAKERQTSHILVPKWFLGGVITLLTAMIIGGATWAHKIDRTTTTMSARLESLPEIARNLHAHLVDPTIHHAKLSRLEERLDALERRLERLENGT